jgi:uncharacterized protein (DUF697 family)
MALPLRFGAILGLVRELGQTKDQPILVGGVLADELARALSAGGDSWAVRRGGEPKGVEALVYAIGETVTAEDERALKAAHRARVPAIVVATGREVPKRIPFVLATDIVRSQPGRGFPVEAIADALADRLGEEATSLAAHLPVLRPAVVNRLIEAFSRKNGFLGAAIFIPGADLPVLTVNQLRMMLRICAAYGLDVDRQRVPEILATIGAGFGFRFLARELLGFVPIAGWIVKGFIAYAGTRAVGEAAVRYCEVRTGRADTAATALTLRPASASPSSS